MNLRREGLYEDIPLHACTGCASLWMTAESLDRLDDNINVDASRLNWVPTSSRELLHCPVCPGGYRESGPTLEALGLPGAPVLVIHRCRRCQDLLLSEDALDRIRSAVIEH